MYTYLKLRDSYTVTGTGYSSDLARDSPNATFFFFFPSSTGGSNSSSLTVKVKDPNGLSTNFAIPNAVTVLPTVDPSKTADAQFDDNTISFGEKMAKILANIESLKAYYSKATGTALRRALRQTAADQLAKLSGALSLAMTTVTTEATKAGVDLKDPAVSPCRHLNSLAQFKHRLCAKTAGALVNFFSAIAPVATKTGALSESAALQGTQLLLKVIKENPNLANTPGVDAASLAGLVAALPPTSSAAASIRQETQKALADVSARITLSSNNTACGDQNPNRAAGDVSPRSFKVIFPSNSNAGGDFHASISELAASFAKAPAGYRFLSPILEVTAASLAGQLTQFPGGIQFDIPATGSVATGQSVSLRWLDTDGSWKTDGCSAVSRSSAGSGAYSATCNHLTAFALLADSSSIGSPFVSAGVELASSALMASLVAAAALLLSRFR
eukprot:tig00020902_g15063.t1